MESLNVFKDYYVYQNNYGYEATTILIVRKHGEAKEGPLSTTNGYAYVYRCKIEFYCDDDVAGLIMEYAVNNGLI